MVPATEPLRPGSVWWAWLDPAVGREQSGQRPAVVVASPDYLDVVDSLVIMVPVTASRRGWPNHIPLTGTTDVRGWAMTEQIRTISRQRLGDPAGVVDGECLTAISTWLGDFLIRPDNQPTTA